MYKNLNCIVISNKDIDKSDISKIEHYFNLVEITSSEKNLQKEYLIKNKIEFAIIYSQNNPIEFCINTANYLKNLTGIHSIIIDDNTKYDLSLSLYYIVIMNYINELDYSYKLIYQNKLTVEKKDTNFDFFLTLSELINEIVIITDSKDEIIYINGKGIDELNVPTRNFDKGIKICDAIDIRNEHNLEKIDLAYSINNNSELKNILITNCVLNLKNHKEISVDLYINTIAQNNIAKLIIIKNITHFREVKSAKEFGLIDERTNLYNIKALENLITNNINSTIFNNHYIINLDFDLATEYKEKEVLNINILKAIVSRIISFYSEYVFRFKDNNLIVLISTNKDEKKIIHISEQIKKLVSKEIKKERFIILKFNIGILEINLKDELESQFQKLKIATKISSEYKNSAPILYKEDLPELKIIKNQNKIFHYILKAIENDFFTLYYQKITPLKKELKPKIEILTRLFDYAGKQIPNDKMFNLIDKYNLTVEVDKLIIKKALREYKKFIENNGIYVFSINISPYSLKSEDFRFYLKNILLRSYIPLSNICLEITETGILENFEIINQYFRELKSFGVQLALDDFGSGYTSLSYIKILPIDILKIDGSFIKVISSSLTDFVIIKSIKDIADTKGIKIIAEFVSSEEILSKINELELDYGQGFLWHKPEPIQ